MKSPITISVGSGEGIVQVVVRFADSPLAVTTSMPHVAARHIDACVKACDGLNPEAVQKMLKVLEAIILAVDVGGHPKEALVYGDPIMKQSDLFLDIKDVVALARKVQGEEGK